MQRFVDKVAVVIGGNSGIGLAAAKGFAEEGARVFITGRNRVTLEAAVQEIGHGALAYSSEISDVRQIFATFAEVQRSLGRIDILFVSAGVLAILPIQSATEADWDRLQSVNLKGTFFCVQAAVPLIPRGGVIVLTGSTAGCQGIPTAAIYGATKAGVRSLGRSFAAELLEKGIRVNVVSPGPTDTPIFRRAGGVGLDDVSALLKAEIESVPMRRMGTPIEIAAAVLFLASDAAAFVTGIEFLVDGGTASI